jgi:hypothetical protein
LVQNEKWKGNCTFLRSPSKPTAARFDEPEPAATKSKAQGQKQRLPGSMNLNRPLQSQTPVAKQPFDPTLPDLTVNRAAARFKQKAAAGC